MRPDLEWYVTGELVVDRILGVRRCERVMVHAVGAGVKPTDVRKALGIAPIIGIDITDAGQPIVTGLDCIALLPTGDFFDLSDEQLISRVECPTEVVLKDYELSAFNIVRLYRLASGYPELRCDAALLARLEADFTHLQSISSQFPDLEALLLSMAPVAAWRAIQPHQ